MTDVPATLAALAEPNRLRIVELLHEAPRSVGEIAERLQLRQPQATKHLQALQRAGLVAAHPLGTRRIYALGRAPLRELRAWLEAYEAGTDDEDVLARYAEAIAADTGAARMLSFERALPARPAAVWDAWTTAAGVRAWWAPRHFAVADGTVVEARAGGALRIVMAEGDGTRHVAEGRFTALRRPRSLAFELAPLDGDGRPLFTAAHDVAIAPRGRDGATLTMAVRVTDVRPGAEPVLAGMEPGWAQTLDRLAETLGPARARRPTLNG